MALVTVTGPVGLWTYTSPWDSAPEVAEVEQNSAAPSSQWQLKGPSLRLHLLIDPAALVAARAKASGVHKELLEEVEVLDRRLADGRKSQRVATKEILALLEKHAVSNCYEPTVTDHGMVLTRDEAAWAARRRTDGVRLFALHPGLQLTLDDTIDLYAAKMAVEVDFHVIKSTTRIRPVHHNTDHKVRAHVDLCVLALAIERALTAALPDGTSARAAFEELQTVRLIDVAPDRASKSVRVVTTPSAAQRTCLKQLGMSHLSKSPAP